MVDTVDWSSYLYGNAEKLLETMGNLISRTAAAKLLGCTPQTVSNYASAGLVDQVERELKGRKGFFYDTDQLRALAPKLHELSELEKRIEERKAALREEGRKVDLAIGEARREVVRFAGGRKTWKKIQELVMCAFQFAGKVRPSGMSAFESKVLDRLLKLEDFDAICKSLGASEYKVNAALSAIMKRMLSMKDMKTQLDILVKEMGVVWDDNMRLQRAYDLQTALADAEAGLPVRMSGKEAELASRLRPYRSMYLSETDLSGRAKNALWMMDVRTVFDLAGLREDDFRLVRGVGSKTIDEIRDYLKSLGLDLGMHDMNRKVAHYDYVRRGSLLDYH